MLSSVDEVEQAVIVRERLLNGLRDQHGPFDVIGDVHGCLDELLLLLDRARLPGGPRRGRTGGRRRAPRGAGWCSSATWSTADRPRWSVLRLAMGMTAAGHALAVPGNHEAKLIEALDGRNVQASHGLERTLAELAGETDEFQVAVREWCRGLICTWCWTTGTWWSPTPGSRRPTRPGVRTGALVRALRRHHRRDRRVWAAGAPAVGAGYRGRALVACRLHADADAGGSTTRSAWTPAASSAASSRRCATPSGRRPRSMRPPSTTSR
ncbi:MAG: hypothetical protein R2719_05390 [Micropruina sp.]